MEDTYSDRFEAGKSDIDLNNRNVEWMNYKFWRISYVLFVILLWGLLHVTRLFSTADCWSVVHIIHGVVRRRKRKGREREEERRSMREKYIKFFFF